MKYTIAIETRQFIEVDAETEDAAIETVKKQLDPRIAAAANISVLQEMRYNEENKIYHIEEKE